MAGTKVTTAGSFLAPALVLGVGWEAGEEYGIQCSGSQMFSSHNNSGNTHTALRAGHAVDKGIANTSCPLLWKGEMKKEEWIIN